jgi:cell wall-associated NlpC family hydrolase
MHRRHRRHLLGLLTAVGVLAATVPAVAAQPDEDPSTTTTASTTSVPESTTTTASTSTTAPPRDPLAGLPPVPPTQVPPLSVPTTVAELPLPPAAAPIPDRRADPWALAPRFSVPADDSLASAQALLAQVIAEERSRTERNGRLEAEVGELTARVEQARREVTELRRKRKQRAVSAFMTGDSMVMSKLTVDDDRIRLISMMEGVDRSTAAHERRIRSSIPRLEERIASHRTELERIASELEVLAAARTAIWDKITGTIDLSNPVPVGPTDIARTAAEAATLKQAIAVLLAAGDAAGAETALTRFRAALDRLAVLVAGPTPGAYPVTAAGEGPAATRTTTTTTTTTTPEEPSTTVSPARRAIADELLAAWTALEPRRLDVMLFALQQVGKRYIWAASGPDAYDCSGLVMRAWILGGVKLAHFSGTQIRSGPPVPPDQLMPTDLLGYGPASSEHITMYLGAGRVVEAKGSAYGVIVADARLSGLAGATRIL